MNRRAFLATMGGTGALAVTMRTAAQPVKGIHRIGLLKSGTAPYSEAEFQRIFEPFRKYGWIVGQNLFVERRWATKAELFPFYVKELVRLNVEMIVTVGTGSTLAAKNVTKRIPILMLQAGDPVRTGLVESLQRPGGNITGYSLLMPELDAKSLALLRELLPSIERVGVLAEPASTYTRLMREERDRVFRSLGMQAIIVPVSSTEDLAKAVADAARHRSQALVIPLGAAFTTSNAAALADAAIRHDLPTMASHRGLVAAGALLSLMPDEAEQLQIVAYLADKILRGTKPAALPVQQPSKFLLSVNLTTAELLGLKVPQSILQRADEWIR